MRPRYRRTLCAVLLTAGLGACSSSAGSDVGDATADAADAITCREAARTDLPSGRCTNEECQQIWTPRSCASGASVRGGGFACSCTGGAWSCVPNGAVDSCPGEVKPSLAPFGCCPIEPNPTTCKCVRFMGGTRKSASDTCEQWLCDAAPPSFGRGLDPAGCPVLTNNGMINCGPG